LNHREIASLGMYDYPHTAAANDRLWKGIQKQLGHGPDVLTRDHDPWEIWQSPHLVFSQTCGLPYRAKLHGKVKLVGTPDYGIKGCPAGYYNSVIVVQKSSTAQDEKSLTGQRLAYNEALSQSGWAAPQAHMAKHAVDFKVGPCTGGHKASAQAVATGRADFAALDALTWAMLQIDDPETSEQLRVLAATDPTPALPFITSKSQDSKTISAAISNAINALDDKDRAALHLKALVQIPASAYLAVPIPSEP
jgi:ABC-type phosphate/phosphonate transport system substrate-binding protein